MRSTLVENLHNDAVGKAEGRLQFPADMIVSSVVINGRQTINFDPGIFVPKGGEILVHGLTVMEGR